MCVKGVPFRILTVLTSHANQHQMTHVTVTRLIPSIAEVDFGMLNMHSCWDVDGGE